MLCVWGQWRMDLLIEEVGIVSIGFRAKTGLVDPTRNPHVSRFASRLQRLYRGSAPAADKDRWHAVEEVLSYAARAEQRLAEMDRQVKYLEALSEQDQLTGIANRRGLEKFLDRTLGSAKRHHETGVLIFADLDDFKQVNDLYGHDGGDRVLKRTAEVLRHNTRCSDFVARLGGDEFVIVMPRTNPKIADALANKLQDILEDTVFPCGDVGLSVRASFGVVVYDHESDRSGLLNHADQAMYSQKRQRSTLLKFFGAAQ
jgi:diguanylate cyclase (GGDEF)-like protein